ncbi:MAG: TonB-dependent receptor [Pseudohongiellaceae bacterium]
MSIYPRKHSQVLILAALLATGSIAVQAQSMISVTDADAANVSFHLAPTSSLNDAAPLISIARSVEAKDFEGNVVENALNFNLGVTLAPLQGLNLRADAWRQQVEDAPAVTAPGATWQEPGSDLYLEDSSINEFNLDNPLLGSELNSNGFDLGASYVWDSSRFGQFTLSTKATYVQEFENNGSLLDLVDSELGNFEDRVISPELQSSLMLTWQFGNHTASAITNYFDSFKDISELDLEEINALVDNITTFDLQYGYSVKTGDKDQAVITFGIRNIFNEQSAQILNSTTRILDQNGRVAYGSIKYQF